MANDLTTLAKRLRPLISGVTHSIVVELVEGGLTGIHNHQEDAQGGKIDHGLALNGLLDDDHTQYLNETRHDTTTRHPLGSVVPHDSHSGLTGVTANQHHNQVHGIVSADHTVTGSALDVIGLSAANTLGVLTPSSDVGTTPAAKVLRSTASGGLTLGTLTVKGAVDITQDLTVGTNVLLVDVSGNNVGIAGAPDPQFALDVNGPFHADAIYGPLGRLLKDCIFLAHYDGPPGTADYSGSPQTVQGQIPTTLSGGVVYRPGVYGKALQAAEATTNKLKNPIFGHGTWNNYWTAGADLTAALNANPNYVLYGTYSAKVTRVTSGSNRVFSQSVDADATTTHTLSAYVKKAGGGAVSVSDLQLYYNGAILTTTYTALEDGWYLLHAVVTAVDLATLCGLVITALSTDYYIGGLQFEAKGYPTPLAHGDMGPGHSWGGVAHESTSSRTVTQVIYTGVTMPAQWTIGGWFQPWLAPSEHASTPWVFGWGYDASNLLAIYYSDGLNAIWRAGGTSYAIGSASSVNRLQKYHVAISCDGSNLTFRVDGVEIGSIAIPTAMAGAPTILGIGNYHTGFNTVSGLLDDWYIVEYEQSEDDIKALIDSEVPVASEHGVTSWYSGGIAPIWVDSDGMWMRDMNGDPVFGWSAVNGKSWGGVTLDMGDNLIGRYGASLGGWQQWDRSAGELALGYDTTKAIRFYAGNAEITGKLVMPGTSSAIAIGATPPTGAAAGTGIWIDRTGLYGLLSGVRHVKIDATNGYLVAGNDDFILNASGFYIEADPSTLNKIYFTPTSGTRGSEIYGTGATGVDNNLFILSRTGDSTKAGRLYLRGVNNSGVASEIELYSSESNQYIKFSHKLIPMQATTAGAPAYQKGAIYFDTTLNKLRVGGATAWETITSA